MWIQIQPCIVSRSTSYLSLVRSQRSCRGTFSRIRIPSGCWFSWTSSCIRCKFNLFCNALLFIMISSFLFINHLKLNRTKYFQLCPHLLWQTGFYLFGTIGIVWTLLWLILYHETNSQDEIPLFVPKVVAFS